MLHITQCTNTNTDVPIYTPLEASPCYIHKLKHKQANMLLTGGSIPPKADLLREKEIIQ